LRPLDQPLQAQTAQLSASPTSHEEDKHRTNQKHYKQYFCDAGRTSSDATDPNSAATSAITNNIMA
jgi:hypothetical protein